MKIVIDQHLAIDPSEVLAIAAPNAPELVLRSGLRLTIPITSALAYIKRIADQQSTTTQQTQPTQKRP